jgi:integrase
LEKGYINLRLGGFCGIKIKNNKEREVECPSALMLKLFEYKLSKRHLQRKEKYADLNPDQHIPLFLNNRGKAFSEETLNARWSEIRATITERIGREFQHKAHNLRATYGVSRLRSLMRAGLSQEDALAFVQHKMGHEDLSTTLSYLKQTQAERTGAEMAEQAYDHLFDLAGVEL